MGLRITTNLASESVQRNLKEVSDKSTLELERLSSGKRITKAADDAAGLAIATNLKAQTGGLRQASRNASDGISLVQTAEGGLNEVSNILIRLREISVQSASDTLGDSERGFLDKEYQQLVSEVDRISSSTTFNGVNLLNGESELGTMDFQVGAFGGDANVISYDSDASNSSSSNIGIDGSSVVDKDDAINSIEEIDQAIQQISGQRATLGSVQSRLESSIKNIDVQVLNQESARSVIEDVDIAYSSSKLASANVVKQAGISTLAQANNIPNSAIRLLG
jgi:flagellin